MNSVREIIDALGGPTEFGRICGFTKNPAARGSDMRQRGSIPVIYWPRIVDAAKAAGKPITNDILVGAHQPGDTALRDSSRDAEEQARPLRCLSPHGSSGLATEGQSR